MLLRLRLAFVSLHQCLSKLLCCSDSIFPIHPSYPMLYRFPAATKEELNNHSQHCAICRDKMLSSAEKNNRIFGLFVGNGDIRMFSSQ